MRVVYLLGKDNNPDVINMTLEIVRKTENPYLTLWAFLLPNHCRMLKLTCR